MARRNNAENYNRLLKDTGLVAEGIVTLPEAVYRAQAEQESKIPDYHIYNQFVLRVEKRDELIQYLHGQDIGCEIYYPIPLHRQACMAGRGFDSVSLPQAELAASQTLALPIFPELGEERLQWVVEKINSFYRG